jgi:aspartate kinase
VHFETEEVFLQIVVLKYGGSCVATTDNLRAVARQIIRFKESGEDPMVVVSAMGETTDHFLTMAYQITDSPTARELDMLLSVGERISIALLAMAINALGPYQAVSLTGSQVGIITDTQHTRAKILEVRCARIYEVLKKGQIPIVAGFQGVSVEKEITTLGRGGSDTTAVALAAALKAKQCRLMKDVNGVYTADPRIVPEAKVIEQLDYDQILEFSATGSKVLATDSVTLAKQHQVEIAVARVDHGAVGTIITAGDFSGSGVQGLVSTRRLIALKLAGLKDLQPALAQFHAEDLPVRGLFSESMRPLLLIESTVEEAHARVDRVLENSEWGKRASRFRRLYARISAIGRGLEPGGHHFARLYSLLESNRISPRWVCSSPVRFSFCLPDGQLEKTLINLHRNLFESPAPFD